MSHSACTDSERRGQEARRIQGKAKATTEKGQACMCVKMLPFLWQNTPGLLVPLTPWPGSHTHVTMLFF